MTERHEASLRRRELLGVAVGLTAACGGEEPGPMPAEPAREVFVHGVASGDPLPAGVILWTRVTRRADTPSGPVEVRWRIARDPGLTDLAGEGTVTTDVDRDDTVKIDAGGLSPGAAYYFAFDAEGETSPIGRTRTAPAPGASPDRMRIAFCSCSNYRGYFNVYRRIAARADLDLVIHLGDYIYEGGGGSQGRAVEPPYEIVSLDDYRMRYAHYRRDPDLQEVHRQHPFVVVWDDHESANDSYADGAGNHQESEGDWGLRKEAAIQAYFEWMPIREDGSGLVQRVIRLGGLVDLVMLDTRLCCRDRQADSLDDPLLDDPDRSLLGAAQEQWLTGELVASTAQWRLLGQQVMMGHARGLPNPDQWDGYPFARSRFFELLRSEAIDNVVVLTGDIHSSWAMDLTDDPFDPAVYDPSTGAGAVAVELVTPAVTSSGLPPELAGVAAGVMGDNPHMSYVELTQRGYCLLDVTSERIQAVWYHVDTVDEISDGESVAAVLSVRDGVAHLVTEDEAAPAPPAPAPAP